MQPDTRHIDAARRRLGHLQGLADRTEQAERAILAGAQSRLDAVDADLRRLAPRAILDQSAGEQYQILLTERGQLMTIISQAGLSLE
jgi:hypothetical protein